METSVEKLLRLCFGSHSDDFCSPFVPAHTNRHTSKPWSTVGSSWRSTTKRTKRPGNTLLWHITNLPSPSPRCAHFRSLAGCAWAVLGGWWMANRSPVLSFSFPRPCIDHHKTFVQFTLYSLAVLPKALSISISIFVWLTVDCCCFYAVRPAIIIIIALSRYCASN